LINKQFSMGIGKKAWIISLTLLLAGVSVFINSCVHAPYVMPTGQRTNDPSICFERDILPIFISSCTKSGCHGGSRGAGGYTLDSYADIMKKGIVPGNVAASKIWETIAIKRLGVNTMPQNAPGLSPSQLDLIRRWIATGAVDSGNCSVSICDSDNYTYSGAIKPMMELYCTGCHSDASSPGGSLADYNSVRNTAVNGNLISDIAQGSGGNPMPKGGIALTSCQVAQVRKWVAAGAANN
jgi:hypothetical protein